MQLGAEDGIVEGCNVGKRVVVTMADSLVSQ